jgi:GDP-L-fucose synthase
MKSKKILITGGTGLVGNAIRKISSDYEYEFIYISSSMHDLSKFDDTQKMFELYRPNYVIHLAACVGGLYKNMNYKVDMLEKNLMINYNVIKCAYEYKVEKLIACLSTCIFPDKVSYPIIEEDLHNGPPHDSNYTYAYAKRMLEIHCRAYRENYDVNFTCITPTNIYGPYDNFDLENGHAIPSLIHKCYLAKKNNIDFVIKGTGKPLRQFIYSEDLARLIMNVMEDSIIYDNVILSVPEKGEISIGDVGRLIANAFEYGDRIKFDANFSDGQYKKTVISHYAENYTFINIEDGINQTVRWFLKNKI